MQTKYIAIATIVVMTVLGLGTLYFFRGSLGNTTPSTNTIHFTIYISERGFNGSADHTGSWPVMTVTQGQAVTIRINSSESVEAHGFAIEHYSARGISLSPNQSYNLTFVADQTGTFRVYCNIFCAVHSLMQNGQLVVSS